MGIDLEERIRFQKATRRYGSRFLNRIFTEKEMRNWPAEDRDLYLYAGLGFSFKEAAWKALPTSLQKKVYFKDIEVLWQKNQPYLKIQNWDYPYHLAWCANKKLVLTLVLLFCSQDNRKTKKSEKAV